MSDSPINFMLYGHTPSFIQTQKTKNKHLKDQLAELVSKLNLKKQQNIRYMKDIENQEEIIIKLKQEIRFEEKYKQTQHSINISKELTEHSQSMSSSEIGLKYRVGCRSTELPNKKAYLDSNNKSIQSSFQGQLMEKKLKVGAGEIKRMTSYGNLYSKKSFSLNKPRFK